MSARTDTGSLDPAGRARRDRGDHAEHDPPRCRRRALRDRPAAHPSRRDGRARSPPPQCAHPPGPRSRPLRTPRSDLRIGRTSRRCTGATRGPDRRRGRRAHARSSVGTPGSRIAIAAPSAIASVGRIRAKPPIVTAARIAWRRSPPSTRRATSPVVARARIAAQGLGKISVPLSSPIHEKQYVIAPTGAAIPIKGIHTVRGHRRDRGHHQEEDLTAVTEPPSQVTGAIRNVILALGRRGTRSPASPA